MYAIVADGHDMVVYGTSLVVSRTYNSARIDAARDSDVLLSKVDSCQPDLLIFDLLLPGEARNTDLIRQARSYAPHSRIIIQTSCTAPLAIEASLQAGADGFVRKDHGVRELLRALRSTQRGKIYIPSGAMEQALGHPWKMLTASEKHVLVALANGITLPSLAESTGRAYKTVANQKYAALEKLGQPNSLDLRGYLVESGLSHLVSD